jgi:hypothetical protein
LGFAAGQRRGLLADMAVVEPDAVQGFKSLADAGDGLEELGGFFHGHVEHVGDALAASRTTAALFSLRRVQASTATLASPTTARQKWPSSD